MWALYHKVIDVNAWKVQMQKDIDVSCPMCDLEIPETLIHKFYDCPRAKMAWTGQPLESTYLNTHLTWMLI